MAKTQHCDECAFGKPIIEINKKGHEVYSLDCQKGHKPRFYQPRTQWGDFGYKRRCSDFVVGGHVKIVSLGEQE